MNQVTISLEDYEAMKAKIRQLEKQVQEKTIVKVERVWHPASMAIIYVGALAILFWATVYR